MDLMEIGKWVGTASDRVILILLVWMVVRYQARKNEEQREQLVALYEAAEARSVQLAQLLTRCTAILERVEERL